MADFDKIFLSTLSLRRATLLGWLRVLEVTHFYPRSPCGERLLGNVAVALPMLNFYPRSPCGERHILVNTFTKIFEFLSTLSLRRATLATWQSRYLC